MKADATPRPNERGTIVFHGNRLDPCALETAIAAHLGVTSARLIARGGEWGTLVAQVDPFPDQSDDEHPDDIQADWQSLYDSVYEGSAPVLPFEEDFRGWNSVYDRAPLPADAMHEWREATVERILSLRPVRVLEIGVGNGGLLARLAPHCECYWATDFSSVAIATLRAQVNLLTVADRVTLLVQAANEFRTIPDQYFDTIIINSIIQYFPGEQYLTGVLTTALRHLAPEGRVFIGDVRNARTQRVLGLAVAAREFTESTSRVDARRALERILLEDDELTVDPDYFFLLGAVVPEIISVDVRLKRGASHNELTRHRYDVVLAKTDTDRAAPSAAISWGSSAVTRSIETLVDHLQKSRPASLRVTGVPDLRLHHEVAALQQLDAGAPIATVLSSLRAAGSADAVDPDVIREVAAATQYDVAAVPSADAQMGTMDLLFRQMPIAVPMAMQSRTASELPLRIYTSQPGSVVARRLSATLSALLDEHVFRQPLPGAVMVIGS